jgi:branched-subunit amino acid transport protein
MSTTEAIVTILGLGAITLLTRGFFLAPDRELPLPNWLREGLRYAPLGAIVAIVVPDIVMRDGALIDTWRDPRLFAAAPVEVRHARRRGVLGTIAVGTSVLLVLRLGVGWV